MIAFRAALPLLALTAACSAASTPVARTPTSPTRRPVPPLTGPHFATPEAAMRYLASAWNRGDLVELKHVTDPSARDLLDDMHREATNLQLDRCELNTARGENHGVGDYTCYFDHEYPVGYAGERHTRGQAVFTVGPADRPGWYMTYFESCG